MRKSTVYRATAQQRGGAHVVLFASRSDGRCQAPVLRTTPTFFERSSTTLLLSMMGSPLWLIVSLAIGLGLGFLVGWKAHVARVRYLRSKRDYYGGKALEYQRNLEQ